MVLADLDDRIGVPTKAQTSQPPSIPFLMANPRDSKTVRLVVIVVLAVIVAYLLYSAS
jgi:hypothetical protein